MAGLEGGVGEELGEELGAGFLGVVCAQACVEGGWEVCICCCSGGYCVLRVVVVVGCDDSVVMFKSTFQRCCNLGMIGDLLLSTEVATIVDNRDG